MNNKKGQTLIETVVALGVLTIVLMGTITLIVNTTSLVLSNRSKTEANALAEKGLTEGINKVLNMSLTNGTQLLFNQDSTELSSCKNTKINRSCTILKVDKTSVNSGYAPINTSPTDINNSGYPNNVVEVISRVTWTDRLIGTQYLELRQLVRVK